MTETESTTDWTQLREFADVDLTQSYVLSWHVDADTLYVDVDVFLMPEHPFYEKPRPAEKVCIRPGCIEFPVCEALGSDGSNGTELIDIAGKLGNGAITGLRRLADARYEITGEFGTVFVEAERPLLRLKSL